MKISARLITLFLLLLFVFFPIPAQAAGNSLEVRVSKSLLDPGESYTLYGLKKGGDYADYEGILDVNIQFCSVDGNCNPPQSVTWSGRNLVGGKYTESLPNSLNKGLYKARYRPNGGSWRGEQYDWSNEVLIFVGRAEFLNKPESGRENLGLYDSAKFWSLGSSAAYPAIFKGMNNTFPVSAAIQEQLKNSKDRSGNLNQQGIPNHQSPIPFRTYFNVVPRTTLCGDPVYTMEIIKERDEAYWGPMMGIGYWQKDFNNRFDIRDFKKENGWHDEYLTGMGERKYRYRADKILQPAEAFGNEFRYKKHLTSSINPQFPGYILAPRYVANGWGISSFYYDGDSEIFNTYCTSDNEADKNNPDKHLYWFIAIDFFDDLSNTKIRSLYPGKKVLRARIMEGWQNYRNINAPPNKDGDTGNSGAREDWYLAKDLGVVRINVKSFTNKLPAISGKECRNNPECINDHLGNPDITLTRYSLLDKIAGDVNSDAAVNAQDAILLLDKYGNNGGSSVFGEDTNNDNKINGWDFVELLSNFGK